MANNDEFTGDVELSEEESAALGEPPQEEVEVDADEDQSMAVAGMTSPEEEQASREEAAASLEESQQARTVPHQAMHEERTMRQQAQESLKQSQDLNSKLMERMDLLVQRMTPAPQTEAQPEPEQIPDRETEPFAYMEYLENRVNRLDQTQQQVTQQTQQEKQFNSMLETGNTQARQFRETLEDPAEYDAAFSHMMQTRGEELLEMGFQTEQIAPQLQREVLEGMQYALSNKVNPGQMLYNMAKRRGFVYNKQGEPQAAPNARPRPAAPKQGIDYAAAAKANRSMSNGGAPRQTHADMATIADMSDDDFEKWLDANGDKGLALAHGLT